jgi:DNA (cytosine-5)-methyltransferase 1
VAAYYNEFDPHAAQWLRNLIAKGLIPNGDVDQRSIENVKASELVHYTQCHFFAGIGGWGYALRQAGWPDDRPVWTGSCPCQPFSTAGKQKGKLDDRHLWPIWFNLIKQRRPSVVFGEQVSSAITHGWLDEVADDMEAEGYAIGASVLPACSVGAPHKRDRLWFVGHTSHQRGDERSRREYSSEGQVQQPIRRADGVYGTVGNPQHNGQSTPQIAGSNGQAVQHNAQRAGSTCQFTRTGDPVSMADTCNTGLQRHGGFEQEPVSQRREGEKRHHWSSGVFIDCPDGKQRLIEPSISLLSYGVSAGVAGVLPYSRQVALKGLGNAIVPQVAAEFIKAYANVKALDLIT